MNSDHMPRIVVGAYATVLPVIITAWSWKVGVAFFFSYLLLGLFYRLRIVALAAYLSVWGYIWWGFGASYYRALVRDVDVITKAINLTIPTFLIWILLILMCCGLPWHLIKFPRKKTKSAANGEEFQRTGSVPPPDHGQRVESCFDPYRTLGVSPLASAVEIDSSYKREMGLYHPDKVAHLGDDLKKVAHERTLEIQRAYHALTAK